jgi:DNA-binding transcriptional ArsR family regulator
MLRSIQPAPTETSRLVQALAHPFRSHILEVLTVEGATTVEHLARATGRPRDTVAYHLQILEECGAAERLAPEAGAETTFRPGTRSVLTDEEWAQLPLALRRELDGTLVDRIGQHVRSALSRGGFDRTDSHVAWHPMSLDEAGHQELVDLLLEIYERTMAIQAGSDSRRPDDAPRPGEIKSEAVVLHFLRDPSDDFPAPQKVTDARSRERMHELADDLSDQVATDTAPWATIAERARELAELAEQRAAGF